MRMERVRWWVVAAILAGCGGEVEQDPECSALCDTLVLECEYGAFPKYESCLEGCLYSREEGAAVGKQLSCVEEAECDTFAILECEHAYGAAAE